MMYLIGKNYVFIRKIKPNYSFMKAPFKYATQLKI